jgi:hypothetical protein
MWTRPRQNCGPRSESNEASHPRAQSSRNAANEAGEAGLSNPLELRPTSPEPTRGPSTPLRFAQDDKASYAVSEVRCGSRASRPTNRRDHRSRLQRGSRPGISRAGLRTQTGFQSQGQVAPRRHSNSNGVSRELTRASITPPNSPAPVMMIFALQSPCPGVVRIDVASALIRALGSARKTVRSRSSNKGRSFPQRSS